MQCVLVLSVIFNKKDMSYAPKYKQKVERKDDQEDNGREDSQQRQQPRRPKYKERYDRPQEKYVRDEGLITYYSKLPEIPEVKKNKPNEEAFNHKLKEVNDKIQALKGERTEQKSQYKKQTSVQNARIDEIKANLKLGDACIKELQKDIHDFEDDIDYTENQIRRFESRIHKAEKKPSVRQEKKPFQKWTTADFQEEIRFLEKRLSKEALDQRGSEAIISQISKLQRQKVHAPEPKQEEHKYDDAAFIEKDKENLHKEKEIKNDLALKKLDTQFKIQAILAQLQRIEKEKALLEKELEDLKEGPEFKKSKECKAKIIELREERDKIRKKHETAIRDYEDEQKLIEYVRWASDVQKRKKEENQYEKERRRKEKLRDQQFKDRKEKQGGKEGAKDDKTGQPQEERVRPPPPHPFAQEMENLRFLVSYCERLKPSAEELKARAEEKRQEIDLESAIKSGDWAAMKGITVVASKKKDIDDDNVVKKEKKQKPKVTKELLPSSQLEHSIEVVRYFDNFKVVPPQKLEEIDNVIKELYEKIEYYRTASPDIRKKESYPTGSQKPYRKKQDEVKGSKKPAISMADFPSL